MSQLMEDFLSDLDGAASEALDRVGQYVENEAKKNTKKVFRTPMQGGASVGTLRASISHRVEARGTRKVVVIGAGGPAKAYAALQELGGRTGRNLAVYVPPHSYLRPAVTQGRSKIGSEFAAAMKRRLK